MAGIYIHIPFCKTRCSYCDFFTQTSLTMKEDFIDAVCEELLFRKDYLKKERVKTVYFGGGTPSQLSFSDFDKIFSVIDKEYGLSAVDEITLEANPDDLKDTYIRDLSQLPFNRISIGIQSFNNNELAFLDRRHSAEDAINAVKYCQDFGFHNISIDLMYGLPNQTMEVWNANLEQAVLLNIQHISAYHLIYEEGTKMHRLLKNASIKSVDEDISLEMFDYMNKYLKLNGFVHYEISNFCKENFLSQHNTSYWTGDKYLGVGPSAHSYNGVSRNWNVSSLRKYINGVMSGNLPVENEILSLETRYNDFVLTRMRTMWGLNLEDVSRIFGLKFTDYVIDNVQKYLKTGDVELSNGNLKLTEEGLFISDAIMSDLMYI